MIQWWEALSLAERIFALLAVPATVLLVLQTILLLFGFAGHDADMDADTSGLYDGVQDVDFHDDAPDLHAGEGQEAGAQDASSGLRMFTVRGFVAFFAIFGWTGLAMSRSGVNIGVSAITSFLAGLAAMVVLALIIKFALKLQSSGNLDVRNAVGKGASVYLSIPPERTGTGKVNVMVQEQLCEMEAVTDHGTSIQSGAQVTVLSITNNGILVVAPKEIPR